LKTTILLDNIIQVYANTKHFKFPAKAEYEEDFLKGDLQYKFRSLNEAYNGITCSIDECEHKKNY